ncbi:nucleoid-associated protein [Hydrogenophaga taeniospiralis]|uniref:nucleoid-associated protein n=1 Tax=Hydrogenophaga taeniospiralis TaxID=65656 RepID=UPI001CFBC822|nr:nucleoid-associated protein [Hydrogenophaga taeniospiralis]MCB4363384.1 nucleoid-associated protein [Hydrogenophaga taeniospiralis]
MAAVVVAPQPENQLPWRSIALSNGCTRHPSSTMAAGDVASAASGSKKQDRIMSFENLSIGRLIIHEVFARGPDRALVQPNYGNQLLVLPQEARDALQARITNALGQSSHGVEMSIRDFGAESTWKISKVLIESQGNDQLFVNLSQSIATKLAVAQGNRTIPGGIVVVIEGTCGNPSRSFMCIIKAEPHGGFTKRQANGQLTLEYIKELILTPQAKLYKIGAFLRKDPQAATVQNPTHGWHAFIFDDLITQGNKLTAAQYFYEAFLGLEFPSNSAFQTKQFHALTKDFIRNANIDAEKKLDLLNALTTYLKVDQAATIQVDVFSQNYLVDPVLQDAYTAHMQQKDFPLTAIHKDLSEVQSQLRLRKLTFGHDIKLTAPASNFEDYIRIESIDGDADPQGNVPKWTLITVRDHIRDQE